MMLINKECLDLIKKSSNKILKDELNSFKFFDCILF